MAFPASTYFQAWASRLRLSIMGIKGTAILTAFAKVLGDMTVDWGTQANLEHLSDFAGAQSVALIASERQLDTIPGETTAAIGARAPQWITLGRFVGTPLGMLLGLHFRGFDNAVIVTQNGMAYQLSLPLPPFIVGQPWDPTPNLVRTAESSLAVALTSNKTPPTTQQAGRKIPAGNSWWAFDNDTDFSSRFAILFPGPTFPTYFLTWARVTFTATSSGAAVWNNVFPDTTYVIGSIGVTVTDGGPSVTVHADGNTKTATGVTLVASEAFTGYADVVAYQAGATNPYADLHPSDLQRLQTTIKKWRPAKATCVGVYVLVQGHFWAWPPQTWGQAQAAGYAWGPSTIARMDGA